MTPGGGTGGDGTRNTGTSGHGTSGHGAPAPPAGGPDRPSGAGVADDPAAYRLPPADPVYGTPTAAELLAAVGDFLRGEVVQATSGHTRYLVRVAANVVDMVRRQCEQGDDAGRRLGDALAALGMADERELAKAIRAGAFDDRGDELRRHLTAAVATRLAVSNPRYLAAADLPADPASEE